MKNFYILILVLLTGAAYGQSNLPACQGSDVSSWSNCSGEETQSDHHQYMGEFLNGKRHGFGVMSVLHPNFKGDKYVGEFKDGKWHGQGTLTRADGQKHVGEYKDGKRNGYGTQTWADGEKYVGEYKDGKWHGEGTYFYADGRIGLGEWVDDKPSGRFIEYRADKTVERSGIFKDGTLVTSQYIDPNSFTRIARNNTSPAITDSQREQANQSPPISVNASPSQPDAKGVVTTSIQTILDDTLDAHQGQCMALLVAKKRLRPESFDADAKNYSAKQTAWIRKQASRVDRLGKVRGTKNYTSNEELQSAMLKKMKKPDAEFFWSFTMWTFIVSSWSQVEMPAKLELISMSACEDAKFSSFPK